MTAVILHFLSNSNGIHKGLVFTREMNSIFGRFKASR